MTHPDPAFALTQEIHTVGDLMKGLSQRYEGIFPLAGRAFETVADAAPDPAASTARVLAVLEAATVALDTGLPHPTVVDCAPGCSACCHLFVAVPPGTAELIALHVDTAFPAPDRATLVNRLRAYVVAQREADDPTRLRRPCPLLAADGRCSVYAVRPIACRAFTSASAARCNTVLLGATSDGAIEQHPARYRLHREATAALQRSAQARGAPAGQRGLCESLLEALEDSGLGGAHGPAA